MWFAETFISQGVVESVKKKRGKKQVGQSINYQNLELGRVYRMHRNIGNRWIEYQQPISLFDQPSNLEIGLCLVSK